MSAQSLAPKWGSPSPPHRLAGVSPTTPVLLALSGGADSVALLHLLHAWKEEYGFSLTAAHVHHGIRGEEADRDAEFCRALCEELGVELCLLKTDIPALAEKRGKGLEETAREVRYEWLASLMCERELPLLATAHHADDHLETVLFRLSRGTGLRGLSGISPARPFGKGSLVRPLLSLSREQILSLCREKGWGYVTDSTNADPDYARNRLRTQVVPVLEALFGVPQKRVLELSARLREDEEFLSVQAQAALSSARSDAGGLFLQSISTLPPALLRRVLQMWAEENGFSPEHTHTEALMRAVLEEGGHREVSLPGDRIAVLDRGRLLLLTSTTPTQDFCIPFSVGECRVPGTELVISVQKMSEKIKVHNLSTGLYIILPEKFVIMKTDLVWRNRLPGDRMRVHGVHRKLGKLLGERAVAPHLRDRLPLLSDKEGPLWVPFVGSRDGLAASPDSSGYLARIFLPPYGQS